MSTTTDKPLTGFALAARIAAQFDNGFVADKGNEAPYVTAESLRCPEAESLAKSLLAEGFEATVARDNDDVNLGWVYLTIPKFLVKSGKARETKYDIDGAIDVAFTLDGHDGEVTLVWDEGNSRWGGWGDPDNWVDGKTIARLRDLDRVEYTEVLSEIEQATAPVAKAFAAGREEDAAE